MSAIVGIHYKDEKVSEEHYLKMMASLKQYPSDDIQIWQKENVFLGCHSQWITPESVGEKQPYYEYNKGLVITADAIIDNREELFSKMDIDFFDRGKMTDSQLILLAFQKWGEDLPKHLVGDFAFMIWDEQNKCMFGARDF